MGSEHCPRASLWTLRVRIRSHPLLGLELAVPNLEGTTGLAHLRCDDDGHACFTGPANHLGGNRWRYDGDADDVNGFAQRICVHTWADHDYRFGIHESPGLAG